MVQKSTAIIVLACAALLGQQAIAEQTSLSNEAMTATINQFFQHKDNLDDHDGKVAVLSTINLDTAQPRPSARAVAAEFDPRDNSFHFHSRIDSGQHKDISKLTDVALTFLRLQTDFRGTLVVYGKASKLACDANKKCEFKIQPSYVKFTEYKPKEHAAYGKDYRLDNDHWLLVRNRQTF